MHQYHRGYTQVVLASVLALILLGLSACGGGGGTDPVVDSASPTSKSLGLIRITVDGIGTPNPSATAETVGDPSSGPTSKALTAQPCFLQIQSPAVSSGAFSAGGQQYVSFTFKVRNAQGTSYTAGNTTCTNGTANPNSISNITLTGIVEPGYGINGTPFLKLAKFDGTNADPSLATTILPTHGMTFDAINNVPAVAIGQESLQVLTESQIASVAVDPEAASGSYLMPYAYMVRNVDSTKGRTLPANPAAGQYDGEFTYSVKLPVSGSKTNAIYSFTIDLQAVTDSVTKVTQSAEEQTALGDVAANIRALTLGSTDLAVLGGSHVTSTNNGDPICSVRIAGPSTAPTAYLTTNNTSANVAAAPYNISGLLPATTVNAGFCQPMTTPAAIYSQFVVSGSQSGLRTANGTYAGTYAGGGSNQLSFTPNTAHPFFSGEQVNFSLANALTSTGGANPVPFVGSYTAGGMAASNGDFVPRTSTATGKIPDAVVVGDFNGDGKADLAVPTGSTSGNGNVTILLGNGDGSFTTVSSSPATGTGPYAIVSGDFNGDGKADLAVANYYSNTVTILLGKGDGSFTTASSSPATGSNPGAIVSGDFNGDGKADLAVANAGSNTVTILLGKGDGNFTSVSSSPATGSYARAMVSGDFNGDGKADLAVANYSSNTVTILLGNGDGSFNTASSSPATGSNPDTIVSADFNGDGKADLAVANYGSNTVTTLLGKGDGSFTAVSSSPASGSLPRVMVSGDFNGDGKADLAVANYSSNTVTILLGNGAGSFTAAPSSPATGTGPDTIVSADFNGDGKADLAVANYGSNTVTILLDNGDGSFANPFFPAQPAVLTGTNPQNVIAADLNGDGLLDMAITNQGSNSISILLAQAAGGYAATSSPPATGTSPFTIVGGDFNGDGKFDLAVTNAGSNNVSVLLGNGSGGFTVTSTAPATGNHPLGMANGDFNGDGKVDLAVANYYDNTLTILLGNGDGTFTATSSAPATGNSPYSVFCGDFNGDGKTDLAVTNSINNTVTILLGKGDGSFTTAPVSPPTGNLPHDIAGGDFNGDGKPDLAVANANSNTVTILLGRGDGSFTISANTPATGSNPGRIASGDLNGDGKIDLAVTNNGSNNVTILLGKGDGTFTQDSASLFAVGSSPFGIFAADFSRTHKLGLAVVNSGENTVSIVPQK